MTKELSVLAIVEATAARRKARRAFMKTAATGVAAVGGLSLLAACGDDDDNMSVPFPTPTPTPAAVSTDVAVLNFALNLEYLEAQFYSYAANGTGLAANLLTGVGTQGAVTGGRKVNFTDPIVAAYAKEIAGDELAHVTFLRTQLGTAAISQPAIDIDVTATSAFSNAARAAGLIGAGEAFDVYANDNNFLLGAYIFEDVGVTAYKGRDAADQQDVSGSRSRYPCGRGVSCRARPDRAVSQGRRNAGIADVGRCDFECTRQPRWHDRSGPGYLADHGQRCAGIEHRTARCERDRVLAHRRAGSQHCVPHQRARDGRRLLPQRDEQPERRSAVQRRQLSRFQHHAFSKGE